MTLAQNRYRYAVYPQKPAPPAVTVVVHDPLNQLQTLRAALVANGFKVIDPGAGNEKAVWLSSMLDDETSARLSQGGTVLLLAGSAGPCQSESLCALCPAQGLTCREIGSATSTGCYPPVPYGSPSPR